MKRINLEQDTPEWLAWRKTVITATEAASIMGMSPYVSLMDVYKGKFGEGEEFVPNDATKHGKSLEPFAREYFVKTKGIEVSPACIESDEYYFLGASLDGISSCGEVLLEIKCPYRRKNHDLAKQGIILPYYLAQIQHQFICSRAKICYFLSYTKDDQVIIEVKPNPEFEEKYIEKAKKFWDDVLNFTPPQNTTKQPISF